MSSTGMQPVDEDEDDEGREESTNRQLSELLSELRVILPAVTVLFAFLLTVPFTQRFADLEELDRAAFFTAFLCTAGAVVFLVGGSAYHRLRGKPYNKERMLRTATRQAIAAIGLLAVGLSAVVLLVTDVLYEAHVGIPVAAGLFVLCCSIWFALPLSRRLRAQKRRRRERESGSQDDRP